MIDHFKGFQPGRVIDALERRHHQAQVCTFDRVLCDLHCLVDLSSYEFCKQHCSVVLCSVRIPEAMRDEQAC